MKTRINNCKRLKKEVVKMKPLFKIGLIVGQVAVVLVAFRAGEVIKAGPVSARS